MNPAVGVKWLAGLAVVLAFGVTAMNSASAAPAKPRMLSSADIPASLGTPYSSDFSKRPLDYVKNLTLCSDSKGGPLVYVPASKPQYSSKIRMEPQKHKVFTSTNERVYVYPSVEAATAAYTQLAQEVLKCTGIVAGPADEDPRVTDTYANGSSPGGQFQSFWVQDSTVFASKRQLENDKTVTYTVYSQAGNSVIGTELYIDGRTTVPAVQKSDLQQLAMKLSSKWAPQ